MPLECALTYSNGIVGSNSKRGRADTSVVVEFNHEVYSPTDPQRGLVTGARVHKEAVIVKEIDKATPSLYQACCQGQTLDELKVDWYRITPAGQEEIYFTTTFTNCKVTSVENILPNTKDPTLEKQTHLERLKVLYEQIMWTHADGFEFTDAWAEAA